MANTIGIKYVGRTKGTPNRLTKEKELIKYNNTISFNSSIFKFVWIIYPLTNI